MKKGAATLFEAAGLADGAPRPLADRLRPASLAEVIGQDHLLGEQGIARAHGQGGAALLGDLLGTARHRQDHGGAAARRGHGSAFRAALGHPFRRLGSAQGVRRGQSAPRGRPRHAAVRRRDPPLQPLAAGRLPAAYGRRHDHSGRRHHRKSLLRAQLGAAVAGERADLQAARRGGDRGAARTAPRRMRSASCR